MRLSVHSMKEKFSTLQSKLFMGAVCVLLLTLSSVGVLSYHFYSETALNRISISNHNYNMTIHESISTLVQETMNYSTSLMSDSQLTNLVEGMTSPDKILIDMGDIYKEFNLPIAQPAISC